jgi:GntR family histidine utilization transcriptional repressor
MPSSKMPAFERVKTFIKVQISVGAWRPGDAVPSEAALQQQFGISRMTVNRALRELAAEGLVTRVQGSGTVVAELHRISTTLDIRDIHEEVQARGHVHSTRVVRLITTLANARVAEALRLPVGAKVFHSILVHFENGVAIQVEDRYVNPASAPDYMDLDFQTTTPSHYLLAHAPLTEASYTIEATLPHPEEAALLGIAPSAPCLVMTRRTVSGIHVASLARLVYPGMLYSFSGELQV